MSYFFCRDPTIDEVPYEKTEDSTEDIEPFERDHEKIVGAIPQDVQIPPGIAMGLKRKMPFKKQ